MTKFSGQEKTLMMAQVISLKKEDPIRKGEQRKKGSSAKIIIDKSRPWKTAEEGAGEEQILNSAPSFAKWSASSEPVRVQSNYKRRRRKNNEDLPPINQQDEFYEVL